GTAPVVTVYTTCTTRGLRAQNATSFCDSPQRAAKSANAPVSDWITPRSACTTYAAAGNPVSGPNTYAGSTRTLVTDATGKRCRWRKAELRGWYSVKVPPARSRPM